MAKRFTETNKWADPWFQDLSPVLKCAWVYILDNCDAAGVWVVNEKLLTFQIGKGCAWSDVKGAFGDRLIEFTAGRVWVPKFIAFQYGTLSEAAKPHQRVIALLKSFGLYSSYQSKEYPKGIDTLEEEEEDEDKEEDKEEDKDEEEDEEGERGPGKGGRARNLIWDCLCEVFGLKPVTRSEKTRLGKAVREYTEKSATPEEIRIRASRYQQQWPSVAFTAEAVLKHWDLMGRSSGRGINGTAVNKSEIEATMRRVLDAANDF